MYISPGSPRSTRRRAAKRRGRIFMAGRCLGGHSCVEKKQQGRFLSCWQQHFDPSSRPPATQSVFLTPPIDPKAPFPVCSPVRDDTESLSHEAFSPGSCVILPCKRETQLCGLLDASWDTLHPHPLALARNPLSQHKGALCSPPPSKRALYASLESCWETQHRMTSPFSPVNDKLSSPFCIRIHCMSAVAGLQNVDGILF